MKITETVFARAGLLGNPSDGYGGKTISLSIENFHAQVELQACDKLEIIPSSVDSPRYESIEHLAHEIQMHGYYGGVRLIKAALKRLYEYAVFKGHTLDQTFSIRYSSNIARQVGFAGSSAIIIATIKAVARLHQLEIDQRVLPSLALSVEKEELNIPAGLQDRVIQSYGGMVYMDFSPDASQQIEGFCCGTYSRLNWPPQINLYVAYMEHAGEPTEILHNDLRQRFDQGDKAVVEAMHKFADLAEQGCKAIEQGDAATLAHLIDQNFDLRQSICKLHPDHVRMISTARECGASAKYCGSGGAIIGTFNDTSQFEILADALSKIDCQVIALTAPTIKKMGQ
jgi:glucuronokinase